MTDAGPAPGALRAAVVQAATVPFDASASTERAVVLLGDAAARGARLAVLPEAFVGGYPKGLDFGASVGRRTPAGREAFRRYHAGAVEVPGPEVERLAAACARHALHAVVGVVERDGGTLYCTSLYLGPGALLAKHRKVMPTAAERLVWGFGDGSTLAAVDTPLGRLGGAICWENYMPMLRMAMYAKGVELWCAPTADDRDTWLPTMRHVALEGRLFVLTACQVMRRRDYPDDYDPRAPAAGPDELLMRGGSAIVGPLGEVLAGPVFGEEAILVADLDLGDIPRARLDFDAVGHYARPDLFQLRVDERPRSAVANRRPDDA